MEKLKSILNAHPVVQMPKELAKLKNRILTLEISVTAFSDFLSFSIKLAQFAFAAGQNYIALIFLFGYFLKEVLKSSVDAFTNAQKNFFSTQQDAYIVENVSNMSNVVRGKIFTQKGNFSRIVTNAEIIITLKDYISYIWSYWQRIPVTIVNIITAFIMSIAILVTEFMQTQNIELTLIFSTILIICIITFSILFRIRFKFRKLFKKRFFELKKENEVLFNDVKNIEPLIKSEFSYRVQLLVANVNSKKSTEKEELTKLNLIEILRNLTLAFFMIAIIIVKLYTVGGVENLSVLVLSDILAISSVYSSILSKVTDILRSIEDINNTLKDAENLQDDFIKITQIYEAEISNQTITGNIKSICVEPFEFTYPGNNSVYKLQNHFPFTLQTGNAYLVYGHTGCGKSTFMHLLTGKIKIENGISPISYDGGSAAYLASIMHESNGKLGANQVLEELIFSQDLSTLNRPKMIEILKGTHIYYDILRNLGIKNIENDDRVLEYLENTTIEQYSSGQKQRLAIVKVLYNLSLHHKIVVFDESTNALDDATAKSVLKFMADYCQRDSERIVFFVTHQVEITKSITNGSITFKQNHFPIFEVITNV